MSTPAVQNIMTDPCASYWLKNALKTALERDPVDAAADADMLQRILKRRMHKEQEKALLDLAKAEHGARIETHMATKYPNLI